MEKKNIAGTVRSLIEPVAEELGYMIWDVEYVKEGADMILRITIDKEEGIDIEDCEKMSRAIDPVIDEADPIESSYRMEVTSPGVERTLCRTEHYLYCIGEKVEVKLYAPVNGQKQFVGILTEADDGKITLQIGESEENFNRSDVAKAQTVFDWN